MTTPLKALIQERLRAKIVRQGDDEGSGPCDGYMGSLHTSFSGGAGPMIDTSEYAMPPPFTDSAADLRGPRGYTHDEEDERYIEERDGNQYDTESKYSRRGLSHYQEDTMYRQYEAYGGRPSARQPSPVKVKRSKRSWRTEDEDNQFTMDRQTSSQKDEEVMYTSKRARVMEKPRHRHHSQDGYASVSPTHRNNYDLSGSYRRNREISSKRGKSRLPDPHAYPRESTASSSSELPHREFTHSHRYYDDEYEVPTYSNDHARRWNSPERTATTSRCVLDNYNPKEDSVPLSAHQHRRLGDVHPVGHVAPPHPIVVSPSSIKTNRRSFSPAPSRSYSNQFEYRDCVDTSSDRMVFPAAKYIPSVPRSPTFHFHRSPDSSEDSQAERGRFRAYSNVLSPGSCQAAKDFVEKRQKRSAQGTPRTMATHRWLQSMMEARRNPSAIPTVQHRPVSSDDTSHEHATYYPTAIESPSNNNEPFYNNEPSNYNQLEAPPRSAPRSCPQPLQAFYSPRMYSAGSFFEAEI